MATVCIPKQPGPSVILTQDLLVDETPALVAFKLIQVALNLWYVEVTNRRTLALVHVTALYTLRQAALAEAKVVTAPYLAGLIALPA